MQSSDSDSSDLQSTSKPRDKLTIKPLSNKKGRDPDDNDNSSDDDKKIDLSKLCKLVKESNNLFRKQLEESVKTRKLLTKLLNSKTNSTDITDAANFTNIEPVIYEGKNLATLGERNLDPARYSVTLARQLWTDDEMKNKMLFPQKINSRESLSPNRSELFLKALKSRFNFHHENQDEIKSAVGAVNQLTSDISRGKRLKHKLVL